MSKLVDDVKEFDLPEKDKLLMTMFPGVLFGFVPPNFKQLEERLSCPNCLEICNKLKKITSMKIPKGIRYKLPWVRKAKWKEINFKTEKLLAEIRVLEAKDLVHWKYDEDRGVGKEFITAFVGRDGWERYSLLAVK